MSDAAAGSRRAPRPARRTADHEESYFVSMSDLMVGLLFIFVILLVYFALQFRQATTQLTDGEITRTEMLRRLEARLERENVRAAVDYRTGVIRLPDDLLFDKGSAVLSDAGRQALARVAVAVADVLPCHSWGAGDCARRGAPVEAVFVEGHTDADPMGGGVDNWDLSVQRAANTYRALTAARPSLASARNGPPGDASAESVLSVSGYGPTRPLVAETSEAAKRRNRRIDIRFVMRAPESPDVSPDVSSDPAVLRR